MRFVFTIALQGEGDNEQQAWLDATETFASDPGDYDEDRVICVREDKEDEQQRVVPSWNEILKEGEKKEQILTQDNLPSDDEFEPRWCASNECEHPECHRCSPVKGCEWHEKCQEQNKDETEIC